MFNGIVLAIVVFILSIFIINVTPELEYALIGVLAASMMFNIYLIRCIYKMKKS
jgi:Mg/Co/Ni transporter MgtE